MGSGRRGNDFPQGVGAALRRAGHVTFPSRVLPASAAGSPIAPRRYDSVGFC